MAANASNNPDDIKKLEELQKQNEEIAKQKEMHAQENEQLQNELLTKEQALELEKKQKEELSALIQQMELKLVHGGHGMDDLSEQNKEQIRKERML